jgi:hypothetical protein
MDGQEFLRSVRHDFTVQSLLFAFEVLKRKGFTPMGDDKAVWIADGEGNDIEEGSELERRLRDSHDDIATMAPLAAWALEHDGEPTQEGYEAGLVMMEAYDWWAKGTGLWARD